MPQFLGVQEALQNAIAVATQGKPKPTGSGLVPPPDPSTMPGLDPLGGLTTATGLASAPPKPSPASSPSPAPTQRRRGGLVPPSLGAASPVNDQLRTQPGGLEHIMAGLDRHFAGNPAYDDQRDDIKYKIQRFADSTQQAEGRAYTVKEAIGVANHHLNSKGSLVPDGAGEGGDDSASTIDLLNPIALMRAAHVPAPPTDPFLKIGLPFSAHDFNEANNEGAAVRTTDGKAMDLGAALALVNKAKGQNGAPMTRTQSQVEQDQEAALGAGSDVGKSIGFAKGQTDAQVPRGARAKDLYGDTHFDGLQPITDSSRVRKAVNDYTEGISQGLQSIGVPEIAAGFIASAPTIPLNVGAEITTLADQQETPANRLGAATNLLAFAATDTGGKLLGEATAGVRAKAVAILKNTPAWKWVENGYTREGAINTAAKALGTTPERIAPVVDAAAETEPVKWATPQGTAPEPEASPQTRTGGRRIPPTPPEEAVAPAASPEPSPRRGGGPMPQTPEPTVAPTSEPPPRKGGLNRPTPPQPEAAPVPALPEPTTPTEVRGQRPGETLSVQNEIDGMNAERAARGEDPLHLPGTEPLTEVKGERPGEAPAATPARVTWDDPRLDSKSPTFDATLSRSLYEDLFGKRAIKVGAEEEAHAVQSELLARHEAGDVAGHPTPANASPPPGEGSAPQPAAEPILAPAVGILTEEPRTAVRNAVVESERAARGLDPVERQAYTTPTEAEASGRVAVDAGADHKDLAKSVASNPRPISAHEHGVLLAGREDLLTEARAAGARLDGAIERGEPTGDLRTAYQDVQEKLDTNDRALVMSGRETSASLNARKMGRPFDPSDPQAALVEARRAKGGRLAPEAEESIKELSGQLADKDREYAQEEARQSKEAAQTTLDREAQASRKAARADRRAELKTEMADLSTKLGKSLAGTANSGIPLGPEQVRILGQMARNAVHQGALTLEEVADFVRGHLPEGVRDRIEDRQIHDALSGYGQAKEPRSQTEAQAHIAELKRVATLTSQIEDAGKGQRASPTSHPPLATPSKMVADLTKVRDALWKEHGLSSQTQRLRATVEEQVAKLEARQREIEAATAAGEKWEPKRRGAQPVEDPAVTGARKALKESLHENRLTDRIAELHRQLAANDFPPPKERPTLSPKLEKLAKERDLLNARVRSAIAGQKPGTLGDFASRVLHFNIFSGTGIFAKLAGATAAHAPLEAITDVLAMPLRRLPAGAGRTLGEASASLGASSPHAYAMGVADVLSRATLEDMGGKLRHGANSLDAAAIARGQIEPHAHHPIADFFGSLHGAIKTPLQRFEYRRGLEMRTEAMVRQGIDVSDPGVQTTIAAGAYNDSLEAILRNENRAATIVSAVFKAIGDVTTPSVGKLASTLVPVTKVGANYVGKGIQYTGAGLIEGLVRHGAGLKEGGLTAAQADAVLKAYKRGGIGVAIGALVLGTDAVKGPGYYAPGAKAEEGEHFGDLTIFGTHVPHAFAHNPAFEAMQVYLTVKNSLEAANAARKPRRGGRPSAPPPDALTKGGDALEKAGFGLAEETPGLEAAIRYGGAAAEGQMGKAAGEYLRSFIEPQALQAIARATDKDAQGNTVKRQEKGFRDALQEGVPGLRENLPEAKRRGGMNPQIRAKRRVVDGFLRKSGMTLSQVEESRKERGLPPLEGLQ